MEDAPAGRAWVLPDESLPIRFMSTRWANSVGPQDDLQHGSDLDAWLDAVGIDRQGARASASDLVRARELRDAVRVLAAEVTGDGRPPDRDVQVAVRRVNEAVASLPGPRIELRGGAFVATTAAGRSPVVDALAVVASECIALLAGPDSANLVACDAPGCVLYFVRTNPRREWCSIACGNRARSARHYRKVREHR